MRRKIEGPIRGSRLVVALALALATIGSACGGDGDGDGNGNGDTVGPEDAFVGTWWIQGNETNFQLSCPYVQNGASLGFFFFSQMTIERGGATDLFVLSEECFPGLPYNLNAEGTAAQAANPDPYIGGAPSCGVVVELPPNDPTSTAPLEIGILELLPGDGWSFTLRPEVAGEPREGDLGGTAMVRLTTGDAAGNPVVQAPCTYTGTDRFMQVTRD